MRVPFALLLLLLASAAVTPSHAATLTPGSFKAVLTVDGSSTSETLGNAGSAGDCDIFGDASGCDLDTGPDNVPRLVVDWVDGDSFDLFFFGQIGLGNTGDVMVSLFDLAFLLNDLPAAITGFALNRAQSNLDDFLVSEGNPTGAEFTDPTLSFTASGVSAFFDDYSGQLDGDGPRFRFDVRTSGGDVAPIPLPAGGVLLAGALVGLGALRRRTQR